jgi:hypothetical protein
VKEGTVVKCYTEKFYTNNVADIQDSQLHHSAAYEKYYTNSALLKKKDPSFQIISNKQMDILEQSSLLLNQFGIDVNGKLDVQL